MRDEFRVCAHHRGGILIANLAHGVRARTSHTFLAFSLPRKHFGNVIRVIHARLHITTCRYARGGVMYDTERRQKFTIILPLGNIRNSSF